MTCKKHGNRFIPVHTGNIDYNIREYKILTVYPCAYREHSLSCPVAYSPSGLSLCIQGTYIVIKGAFTNSRFIPVHTGNMIADILYCSIISVYPCAYREHSYWWPAKNMAIGLSLCIQGTLTTTSVNIKYSRFIPVHTGNIPSLAR